MSDEIKLSAEGLDSSMCFRIVDDVIVIECNICSRADYIFGEKQFDPGAATAFPLDWVRKAAVHAQTYHSKESWFK